LRARDSDVVTGWNVIDFDLAVWRAAFAAHGLSFDIGRTAEPPRWSSGPAARAAAPAGPRGARRLRLVPRSGERFEDLSLQVVAAGVPARARRWRRAARPSSPSWTACGATTGRVLRVLSARTRNWCCRILGRLGLDALTARRAALTGVPLELAWTASPPSSGLRGRAARASRAAAARVERPVRAPPAARCSNALPGFFSNVLGVRLPPASIHRSSARFNIDPLAFRAGRGAAAARGRPRRSKRARFRRGRASCRRSSPRYRTSARRRSRGATRPPRTFINLQNSF